MTAPDVLILPGLLSPQEVEAVLGGLAEAPAEPSTVTGGPEGGHYPPRRSARLTASPAIEALLRERLEAARPALEARFDRPLGRLEPLQILRYRPGDYFVAHQDGNTPMTHDDTRHRRVSVSLLLSAPGAWTGGELVFHGPGTERLPARAPAGGVIAFRSEATHEVTWLETGERLSVAGWFRAP